MSTKSTVELLEDGKKRLAAMTERHTRIQVELETTRRQLNEAKLEAELEYGTSDLGQLRELYKQRETENTTAVSEFLQALDDLDTTLRKTEQALAS